MSSAQISAVQGNWDTVNKDLKTHGCAIFKNFFTEFPQYQDMFPAFKGVDKAAFLTTPNALAHVLKVLEQLGAIVKAMGTPGLDGILKSMADRHTPRNVKGQQFKDLNGIIVIYVCGALGGAADKAAWEACLGAMADGISKNQ